MAHRRYKKLDVVPGGAPVRINVSQGDIMTRTLVFSLFASAGELSIPAGASVALKGKRPDGEDMALPGTLEGIMATFTLPEAALEVPGEMPCNVVISSGGNRLYTEMIEISIDTPAKRGDD